MTNKPTDAELAAFTAQPEWSGYETPLLVDFAPAVLARWGQPAHSGEPTPEDRVFELLRGVDSLDALAVWRAAEAAHGITQKGGQHGPV